MNVYPGKVTYDPLYSILESAKIRSIEDAAIHRKAGGAEAFSSDRFPWANEFVKALASLFRDIIALHQKTSGPTIIHEQILNVTEDSLSPGSLQSFNPFDLSGRYGALFPGRVLFIGAAVTTFEVDNTVHISPRFIYQLLTLRPLIDSGLALLLPSRIVDKSELYNVEKVGTFHHRTAPHHLVFEGRTFDNAYFNELTNEFKLQETRQCRVLQTPSIVGASIADVARAAAENWEEYDAYSRAQVRFFRDRIDSEQAARDWIEDLEDKYDALQRRLEKKRRELVAKGVECFVGALVSAAPMLIPGFPPEVAPYIRSIVGGKSLYDARQWLGQWSDLRKELRVGSPWAIWKP